jgi:hypothetical protein
LDYGGKIEHDVMDGFGRCEYVGKIGLYLFKASTYFFEEMVETLDYKFELLRFYSYFECHQIVAQQNGFKMKLNIVLNFYLRFSSLSVE